MVLVEAFPSRHLLLGMRMRMEVPILVLLGILIVTIKVNKSQSNYRGGPMQIFAPQADARAKAVSGHSS